ncbi:hypothetical protein WUBG_07376 [Wuchereria bancrofti]|uniref:Uncharacterized protein n=1 Tax=Wuchereria bancrofti TaxID=6293 RepID=J9F313_WUCBA|nr:hypothetical protein WUBG_07376 [Wuchereria bancrofti]
MIIFRERYYNIFEVYSKYYVARCFPECVGSSYQGTTISPHRTRILAPATAKPNYNTRLIDAIAIKAFSKYEWGPSTYYDSEEIKGNIAEKVQSVAKKSATPVALPVSNAAGKLKRKLGTSLFIYPTEQFRSLCLIRPSEPQKSSNIDAIDTCTSRPPKLDGLVVLLQLGDLNRMFDNEHFWFFLIETCVAVT